MNKIKINEFAFDLNFINKSKGIMLLKAFKFNSIVY